MYNSGTIGAIHNQQNHPTPGPSRLIIDEHTPGYNLTFDSLDITPCTTRSGGGCGTWMLASNTNIAVLSPVPEPSTLTLMLTGFGLIGFKSNRRRKLSF